MNTPFALALLKCEIKFSFTSKLVNNRLNIKSLLRLSYLCTLSKGTSSGCTNSNFSQRQCKACNFELLTFCHGKTRVTSEGNNNYISRRLYCENGLPSEEIDEQFPFNLKYKKVRVCEALYRTVLQRAEEISEKTPLPRKIRRQMERLPFNGIKFNIAYIDTLDFVLEKRKAQGIESSDIPIAVILHGSPGSHRHFSKLIPFLSDCGVRVIALNFPGFSYTEVDEERIFQHSPEEKASYVIDFLKAISIPKVDILISHSASSYPAIVVSSQTNMINSLALINPASHKPFRFARKMTQRFMRKFVSCWQIPFLRPLLKIMVHLIAPLGGIRTTNVDHFAGLSMTVLNFHFEMFPNYMVRIPLKKIPVLLSYSKNDLYLLPNHMEEYRGLIGIPEKFVTVYDENEKTLREGESSEAGDVYKQCLIFEKGSHFSHMKHPDIVNRAILNLLKHVNQNVLNL